MSYNRYYRVVCSSINSNSFCHTCFVTLVIANNKCYTVSTISKINIIQRDISISSHKSAIIRNVNAVNVDLSCSIINTGHIAVAGNIAYLGTERKKVAINLLTIQCNKVCCIIANGCFGNFRSIAVICYFAIVKSDIVNIEDNFLHSIITGRCSVDKLNESGIIVTVFTLTIIQRIVFVRVIL